MSDLYHKINLNYQILTVFRISMNKKNRDCSYKINLRTYLSATKHSFYGQVHEVYDAYIYIHSIILYTHNVHVHLPWPVFERNRRGRQVTLVQFLERIVQKPG